MEPKLGPDVEFVEELSVEEKYDLLGRASAFAFPLQWEEPFGMVLVEAMACGTPVLSLDRGAVPEIVVDGTACRRHVEENFAPAKMVEAYEKIYRDCLA